jgi:hypothetical protein
MYVSGMMMRDVVIMMYATNGTDADEFVKGYLWFLPFVRGFPEGALVLFLLLVWFLDLMIFA